MYSFMKIPYKLVKFFFFFLAFWLFAFLPFLGPLSRHMEVPRLGVESELQPPAYARAIATLDLSRICNLHHSSRQRQTTEQGQGSNLLPHGYQSDSFLLHHKGNQRQDKNGVDVTHVLEHLLGYLFTHHQGYNYFLTCLGGDFHSGGEGELLLWTKFWQRCGMTKWN